MSNESTTPVEDPSEEPEVTALEASADFRTKKNVSGLGVTNPSPSPVTVNAAGQALGGYMTGFVDSDDPIAVKLLEAGRIILKTEPKHKRKSR